MMLTSLLPDILIVAITVYQIWNFQPSVPFLEARLAAKDMKCASFPNLALSISMAALKVFQYLTLSVFACQKQTLTGRAVTSVLRLGGGGGGWACFSQTKRAGWSLCWRTFQSRINISFPKIVGALRKKNSDIPFFANFWTNVP